MKSQAWKRGRYVIRSPFGDWDGEAWVAVDYARKYEIHNLPGMITYGVPLGKVELYLNLEGNGYQSALSSTATGKRLHHKTCRHSDIVHRIKSWDQLGGLEQCKICRPVPMIATIVYVKE